MSKGRVPAPVANDLRSVACTSASACWAVGTTKAGNGVVVHWSSGGVSRSALPGLASPFAVACASSVSCWAAGSDGVLHGNGRSWTAVHFPKPKHATHFRVDGLSCRSATSCWAVGEWYGDQVTALGNINGSIASLWNGSAWHLR